MAICPLIPVALGPETDSLLGEVPSAAIIGFAFGAI
jgi:hypothetical protein